MLWAFILVFVFTPVEAKPYIPSDTEVLYQLNSSNKIKRLKALRKSLNRRPENTDLACLVAKQYIDLGKAEADPRYYSYASSVLSEWGKKAPLRIKLLQANVLQYQHKFREAIKLLDQIIQTDSEYQEAILMRAAIYTELGKYPKSDQDCKRLRNYSLETTCLALNQSMTGKTLEAYTALRAVNLGQDDASLWSLTILAEVTARLGKFEEAQDYYQKAFAINSADVYLLGSYADFLLDQDRNQEVLDLLKHKKQIESLALRYNLATKVLEGSDA